MNSSWETSRTSSDASSFTGGELRNEIAMILSGLTNLSFFARLVDCLGVSAGFFRVDGLTRCLEERLDILWLLGGIVGGTISEKGIFGFFDLIDEQNW